MKSDKCPSQKGAGVFIVCIPLSPIGKSFLALKTTIEQHTNFQRQSAFAGHQSQLVTFLVWFYLNQARYVYRSAYLKNGFDKLFGYQYHLQAILPERLTTQAMLVLFLPCCLQVISSFGANSSQGKKIYHWVSVGKKHRW